MINKPFLTLLKWTNRSSMQAWQACICSLSTYMIFWVVEFPFGSCDLTEDVFDNAVIHAHGQIDVKDNGRLCCSRIALQLSMDEQMKLQHPGVQSSCQPQSFSLLFLLLPRPRLAWNPKFEDDDCKMDCKCCCFHIDKIGP